MTIGSDQGCCRGESLNYGRSGKLECLIVTVGVIIAIAVGLSGWAVMSYFEADAFARATGREVTVWDAMFINLRVVDSPAKECPECGTLVR